MENKQTAYNDQKQDVEKGQKLDPTTSINEPYTTFTKRQIWILVTLSSVAATFSGLASNIYFPALPTIARDVNVSVTLVNLTVTSYMIFQGLAPPIWGAISDVKGRRVAYICTFLVFLSACIGLAETPNYATLLVLRCLQSTGSASTIAIGSAVIGDITTREERGGFMGVFQAGLLVPLAAGPIIGGALADSLGWRSIFWFLTIYAGIFWVILVFGFPETLRAIVGNGSRVPESLLHRQPLALYQKYQSASIAIPELPPRKKIDLLGPLRVLSSKKAFLIIILISIYYTIWQMSITVMSTLFSHIYHLKETEIGLTFIANGAGSMIGTIVTGRLLDVEYRRVKAAWESQSHQDESDFPLEKARLRLVPIMALLQCASILVFGWTLHYNVHIAVPIITTFVSGWMSVSIQTTIMTYLVDEFPDISASASAALNIARCLLGAGGTAAANPLIEAVGIGPCFSILTGLMLIALGVLAIQTRLRRRLKEDEDTPSPKHASPNA